MPESKTLFQVKGAEKPRRNDESCISTIDGKLEKINIHNDVNTFWIYTSFPDMPSLRCKFPKALLGEIQNALGRYVSASGECFYRSDDSAPYRMNVREIEILPPPEELPSLRDLEGIAPNATGGKTSEQFVREMRDEWDKNR